MHDRCRPLRKSIANMSEDTNLTNVVFKNPVNVKLHVAVECSEFLKCMWEASDSYKYILQLIKITGVGSRGFYVFSM